ncbi:MAG: PH domain-containing protein [Marmoricola sp.]|nr:PH domain-containing protein [Marmoricola sp.]
MADAPDETEVLRSSGMRAVGVAALVAAAVLLALAVTDPGTLVVGAAPALFVALVGWAAFVNPRVEVSDGGVVLVNVFRTVEVPWPALLAVEGRYGLQLRTAYGAFTAWSATAPAGRSRRHTSESAVSVAVRRRWDRLRDAGWLDDPRLERPRARVQWHWPVVAAGSLLLVASVAVPLLG